MNPQDGKQRTGTLQNISWLSAAEYLSEVFYFVRGTALAATVLISLDAQKKLITIRALAVIVSIVCITAAIQYDGELATVACCSGTTIEWTRSNISARLSAIQNRAKD